jgi:hypothetical protein
MAPPSELPLIWSMQATMRDATAQVLGRGSNRIDGVEDVFHQLTDFLWVAIGQFPLGQRPDSFIKENAR